MPTSNERKALWFLALVALSGSAVRLMRGTLPVGPVGADSAALGRQIERVEAVRARAPAGRSSAGNRGAPQRRPSATGRDDAGAAAPPSRAAPAPLVDLDHATAADVEKLPGIGPVLARRIVAHRDSAGAFGSLSALCAVRGVGPALAARLRPLVTFSGVPRPLSDGCGDASSERRKTSRARGPDDG